MKRQARINTGYAISALALLVAWQMLASVLDRAVLPSPLQVFGRIEAESDLLTHLAVSAFRAISGLLAATLTAVPLGLLLGRSARLDGLAAPLIYLIYPVPKVVFLPVIMVLMGLGDGPKIFLIFLIVFFQILVTTRDAARSVSQQLVLSVVSLGASDVDIYRHVIFPAVLPKVLTALRVSLGTAIAVLFTAETFATTKGLGYYIVDTWSRQAYPEMFAGVLAMGVLGLVLFAALDWLEKKICPWQYL